MRAPRTLTHLIALLTTYISSDVIPVQEFEFESEHSKDHHEVLAIVLPIKSLLFLQQLGDPIFRNRIQRINLVVYVEVGTEV